MDPTASRCVSAVPVWIWAGLAVLAGGLGASFALLGGWWHSVDCGSFGMTCIVSAFGLAFGTLCVAAALLLRGLHSMPRAQGAMAVGVKMVTIGVAAIVALAALVLGGFAVMVLTR